MKADLLQLYVATAQRMLLPEVCLATMWEPHTHQGAVAKTGKLPPAIGTLITCSVEL